MSGRCRASLNKAVPIECRVVDDLEGAGGRARDDHVHDFAGGRASAPQDSRRTGQTLSPAPGARASLIALALLSSSDGAFARTDDVAARRSLGRASGRSASTPPKRR